MTQSRRGKAAVSCFWQHRNLLPNVSSVSFGIITDTN